MPSWYYVQPLLLNSLPMSLLSLSRWQVLCAAEANRERL